MKKTICLIFLFIGILGVSLQLFLIRKKSQSSPVATQVHSGPLQTQGVDPDGKFTRYSKVPSFSLLERSGQQVTLDSMRGKVWIADFVFTNCPDICPLLNSRIVGIQKELLASGENVAIVSFSVDPANDTPEVLRGYADHLGADPRWLFMTGDKAQLQKIAMEGFLMAFSNEEGMAPADVSHSSKIALVDQNGIVRRFYEGVSRDESAKIVADVKTLLEEGGRP
ncbi:MAG TPA: SCO family protein [Chthoniobacteraceae bacterium]|nr:SCO family protein [Chthoniobacteraceae bacterium]